MLVGGRLRRAEAGRGRPVHDAAGALVGHATVASPADVTDAVAAARAALPAWSGASAHERGRVLHGIADLLDQRLDRLAPGADFGKAAADDARAAADRWLWYAGWTDKIDGLLGAAHPVAGPYASWSAPRPVGVVGVLAPASLLGLVDALAAVLAAGATAVVVAPHETAPAAAGLAELLATGELPAGAANLLAGDIAELAPTLVRAGVDGLDPGDTPVDPTPGVRVPGPGDRGVARLRAWTAATTVWHPVGR
jgi:acyl-CoA reductase-like NAD-dependent aldehyde dehydrogenase